MGGPGSGNFYHWQRGEKKTTTDSCLSLDANRLSREGVLKAGARLAGRWTWTYRGGKGFSVRYVVDMRDRASASLYLDYTWVWPHRPDEPQSAAYRVGLAATVPRFGGLRWWFLCPLMTGGRACGRRVGKLFLPPCARHFGCRVCHDLTYTSSQEAHRCDSLYRSMGMSMGRSLREMKRLMRMLERRNNRA